MKEEATKCCLKLDPFLVETTQTRVYSENFVLWNLISKTGFSEKHCNKQMKSNIFYKFSKLPILKSFDFPGTKNEKRFVSNQMGSF